MKKLFFTHSTTMFRLVLMLFVLGYSATASAQLKFSASDMVRTSDNSTTWRYNNVVCSGNVLVTSITISMINNRIERRSSSVAYTEFTSLYHDPSTHTFVFKTAITPAQVETFMKETVFDQTADVPQKAQYIHIYVDANPIKLPPGAKITAWPYHPDGSVHYYVWVPSRTNITIMEAYNGAKSYYFQGMRGYLPTITSEEEDLLLTNISNKGGWSAGVRTPDAINDQISISSQPSLDNVNAKNFRWVCGPESGFVYYNGPRYDSSGGGIANGAYCNFAGGEPNNAARGTGENIMQINFLSKEWNDLPYDGHDMHPIMGYFIEFGGNGTAYKVDIKNKDGVVIRTASYKANLLYKTPTVPTSNGQWHEYKPGVSAVSEATVKARAMRAHVMVIE